MKNVDLWDMTPLPVVRTDVSEEIIASVIRVKKNQRARSNVSNKEE
jgi:hypothetical protein